MSLVLPGVAEVFASLLRPQSELIRLDLPTFDLPAKATFGTELKEEQFANIKDVIQSMSDSKELEKARHEAKATAWMHEGEAGKRITDYMVQTLEAQNQTNEEKSA